MAGRDEFMSRLAEEFPDVPPSFGPYSADLLHCEVADFRQATERSIDGGRLWEAEKHFRLVEELLAVAGPALRNALEVSYIEDFARGEWTPSRHLAVKKRMPLSLRRLLTQHDARWK